MKQDITESLANSLKSTKKATKKTAKKATPKTPAKSKTKNRNVSLYESDETIIQDLQMAIFKETGKLPNVSLAIRIALSLANSSGKKSLIAAYDSLKTQDGRCK